MIYAFWEPKKTLNLGLRAKKTEFAALSADILAVQMSAVLISLQSKRLRTFQMGVIVFKDILFRFIGIVTGHLLLIAKIHYKHLFIATLQEKHTYISVKALVLSFSTTARMGDSGCRKCGEDGHFARFVDRFCTFSLESKCYD